MERQNYPGSYAGRSMMGREHDGGLLKRKKNIEKVAKEHAECRTVFSVGWGVSPPLPSHLCLG
jgi:hypothetical protein